MPAFAFEGVSRTKNEKCFKYCCVQTYKLNCYDNVIELLQIRKRPFCRNEGSTFPSGSAGYNHPNKHETRYISLGI